MSLYERSLFFTIFVMLQFWNMFNAKAFASGSWAWKSIGSSLGFVLIGLLILVGQLVIVSWGGEMFSVEPLHRDDWIQIFLVTSVVFVIGEIYRLLKMLISYCKKS